MFAATGSDWSILTDISLVVAVIVVGFVVPYELFIRALRHPGTKLEFNRNFRWMLLVPVEVFVIILCVENDRVLIACHLLFASYVSICYVLGLQLMRQGQRGEKTFGKVVAILAGSLIALYGQWLILLPRSSSMDDWQVMFFAFMTMLAIASHWNIRSGQNPQADPDAKEL